MGFVPEKQKNSDLSSVVAIPLFSSEPSGGLNISASIDIVSPSNPFMEVIFSVVVDILMVDNLIL